MTLDWDCQVHYRLRTHNRMQLYSYIQRIILTNNKINDYLKQITVLHNTGQGIILNIHTAIEDDLAEVLDALSGLEREWHRIGINLQLRSSALDTTEADNSRVQDRLRSAMTEWLRLNYNYRENGLPSWRMLAQAVYRLDRSVFNRIAEEHPGIVITIIYELAINCPTKGTLNKEIASK